MVTFWLSLTAPFWRAVGGVTHLLTLIPNCNTITGKKDLKERVHSCSECGFTANRDVAVSMIVEQRGLLAVGQTVSQSVEDSGIGVVEKSTTRTTRKSRKSK